MRVHVELAANDVTPKVSGETYEMDFCSTQVLFEHLLVLGTRYQVFG